jgi:hypothetical protein
MYGDYFEVQRQAEIMEMEAELRRMQRPAPVVPVVLAALAGFLVGRATR